MIGLGEANGPDRAEKATEEALHSPLLDIDISDARGALINVVGGPGLTLGEAEKCADIIRKKINTYAKIIWGVTTDESLGNNIRVLLVLTGVKSEQIHGASMHTQMRNLRSRTVEFIS
jgi:cell division protein FtsZ